MSTVKQKGTPMKRFRVIRDYWRLLKPFHKVFRSFIALLVLYEALQIAEGYLMSFVIRLYGQNAEVYVWIALFGMLIIYDEAFMRLDNRVDWHVITSHIYPLYKFLKLGAIKKFLDMDVMWHHTHNSGSLVSKVAHGVEKVQEIIDGLSWEFIPTFIQTLLSFIPIAVFSPLAGLVSVAAFIGFITLSLKANKKRQPFRSRRHDLYEEESHRFIESVQGQETLLMFGQTDRVIQEFEEIHDHVLRLGEEEARLGIYTFNRWRIRILTISRRLILGIWVWQLYRHSMDIATIIFVNVLMEKLFSSFWRFARLLDRTSEASEGATRLVDVMNQESKRRTNGTITDVPALEIVLENVDFSYTGNYTQENGVLHDFSLTIPQGQMIALVGESGAGKSTIQRIITGKIPYQGGKISIGGYELSAWDQDALLSKFSFVPQGDEVTIFEGTIRYNIAFSRPDASLEDVVEAAKLAGIHETIMEMSENYERIVGERGKKLSGGQKQRIALARAIIADRPILILDEATSAVDTLTEQEIQRNMERIMHKKTAIVIAHRLSTIKHADKIVVMSQGRKIEEGTHEALISLNGIYAKMVLSQDLTSH